MKVQKICPSTVSSNDYGGIRSRTVRFSKKSIFSNQAFSSKAHDQHESPGQVNKKKAWNLSRCMYVLFAFHGARTEEESCSLVNLLLKQKFLLPFRLLYPISRALEQRSCENPTRGAKKFFQLFSAKMLSKSRKTSGHHE